MGLPPSGSRRLRRPLLLPPPPATAPALPPLVLGAGCASPPSASSGSCGLWQGK